MFSQQPVDLWAGPYDVGVKATTTMYSRSMPNAQHARLDRITVLLFLSCASDQHERHQHHAQAGFVHAYFWMEPLGPSKHLDDLYYARPLRQAKSGVGSTLRLWACSFVTENLGGCRLSSRYRHGYNM